LLVRLSSFVYASAPPPPPTPRQKKKNNLVSFALYTSFGTGVVLSVILFNVLMKEK